MNRDHHEQSELDDFETRLRSLAPRPPLAAAALVEVSVEVKQQVAAGRSWWSADTPAAYAFYRTVGLSATVGALVGAACTLLILNWSKVPAPHSAASVAIATDEVQPSQVSPEGVSIDRVPSSSVAHVTKHNQESVVASDGGSSLAYVEPQPQITSVRRNMHAEYPHDWLDELRSLKPGTLGIGSRLISQRSVRLRAARIEPVFEPLELSGHESPEADSKISAGGPHIGLDSPPLPQRQWMQQMLSSPTEFY